MKDHLFTIEMHNSVIKLTYDVSKNYLVPISPPRRQCLVVRLVQNRSGELDLLWLISSLKNESLAIRGSSCLIIELLLVRG